MRRRTVPPYLKLVASGGDALAAKPCEPVGKPQQLALPYPEPMAVMLADVQGMGRDRFKSLLDELAPRWVIDLRAVPTFQGLAGSRSYAFRMFDSINATYVDILGRLASHNPAGAGAATGDWVPELRELMHAAPPGPYLFLFDDPGLMTEAAHVVPPVLKAAMRKKPRMSILTRSLAEA
ncbi:MAG: hypothetical protein HQL40_01360 [Alphaproteobacteria bacterium]|nr:hypothetical protein [Alphaproteobacteria bacterium]